MDCYCQILHTKANQWMKFLTKFSLGQYDTPSNGPGKWIVSIYKRIHRETGNKKTPLLPKPS